MQLKKRKKNKRKEKGNSTLSFSSTVKTTNDIIKIHQVNVGNAARNFWSHYAHFKGQIFFSVHSNQ